MNILSKSWVGGSPLCLTLGGEVNLNGVLGYSKLWCLVGKTEGQIAPKGSSQLHFYELCDLGQVSECQIPPIWKGHRSASF